MGKKKQFINKKSAASFHIIHRTSAFDSTADAASSLSSLSLSSPQSAAPPTSASSSSSSSSSAYYFQPSKSDTAIPVGFPVDLLVAQNEEHERAVFRRERRTAVERERDSRDPSLLPHEYDYSAHLREIGGGVFISAAGAAAYENAANKRERQQREQRQVDVRGQRPAADDELDREVDWAMVRRAEKEGRKKRKRAGETALVKAPVDVLVALDDDERVGADGGGEEQFDELDDDFVIQAMRGSGDTEDDEEDDEEEEEGKDDEDDEDDMVAKMKQYEMHGAVVEGEDEDGEEEEEEEEEREAEERDVDEDEKAVLPQRKQLPGQRSKQSAAASEAKEAKTGGEEHGSGRDKGEDESFWDEDDCEYEDEYEDEVGALPSRALDKDFDRLLSEQYGDDDIGGLDDVDEREVSGQLSIDSFADSLDAFLSRQSLPVSQGGSDLSLPSAERDTIKRRMIRRLRAMAAEEGHEADIQQWMGDVYKEVVEDGWDVESIVSTYSNTENHPTAIREARSQAAIQQAAKRKEQAQAALAAAITSAVQPAHDAHQQHDDSGSEEGDEDDEADASRNLGVARPRGESSEEKRARKAAMKAEKRESRQRKKQLRTLYASIEHTQQLQHTKASVDNPVSRQLV